MISHFYPFLETSLDFYFLYLNKRSIGFASGTWQIMQTIKELNWAKQRYTRNQCNIPSDCSFLLTKLFGVVWIFVRSCKSDFDTESCCFWVDFKGLRFSLSKRQISRQLVCPCIWNRRNIRENITANQLLGFGSLTERHWKTSTIKLQIRASLERVNPSNKHLVTQEKYYCAPSFNWVFGKTHRG